MTKMSEEDVLFPEEIVPWDEVLRLVINLLLPFRHRAKGIECITGRLMPVPQSLGNSPMWIPCVLDENYLRFIKEHLQELPSLEYPVPLGIANEFIDKFIMLKNSPDMVPSILTRMDLIEDQQKRADLFKREKVDLQKLASRDANYVYLIDASRQQCKYLTHDVYFSKNEAIQYLNKKGLLDRAIARGCSWRDQIDEPEVGGLPQPTVNHNYGLPEELVAMGIQEYRKTLTLRKLAQLSQKSAEVEQIFKVDPGEINTPEPMTERVSELVECGPNLEVDALPLIQASSPSTVDNNNVNSSSSIHPVVSENDQAKSLNKNPVTECDMTLVCKSDPVVKKLIGMNEVMSRLGVSRPTIYNYLNTNSPSYNPNFPQPTKLNLENKWVEAEINAFIEAPNPLKKKTNRNQ